MRRSLARRARDGLGLLVGSVLLVVGSVFPIYWLAILSVKNETEDVYGNPLWVFEPTFQHYLEILEDTPFVRWTANSLFVILVVTALTIVTSMVAGYSMARLRPPGTRWIARLLFASYLLPQTVDFLPLFQVIYRLGLDGSPLSLVMTYPSLTVPFCTWLFYSYFRVLPREVEESGLVEGGSPVAVFLRLVMPMSQPVTVAAAIFAVGAITSDFLYASTFLPDRESMTVAAGIGIQALELEDLGVAAGVNMFATPLALMCLLFARSYVRGLTAAMLEGA